MSDVSSSMSMSMSMGVWGTQHLYAVLLDPEHGAVQQCLRGREAAVDRPGPRDVAAIAEVLCPSVHEPERGEKEGREGREGGRRWRGGKGREGGEGP